jgi:hypothetical protein
MIFGTLDFEMFFQVFRKFGRKKFLKQKFFGGRYSQFEKKRGLGAKNYSFEKFYYFLQKVFNFMNKWR